MGTFPLGSATKSTRLGSAPTAALHEGKAEPSNGKLGETLEELGVLRKEGIGVFCSAPGQALAEDTSGSSPSVLH